MNSKSNLIYALAAVTSLALGFGLSFWRAAEENYTLTRANLTAGLALSAAQDEIKSLQDKLQRETKAHEYAETAKAAAERAGQATREKLAEETKAHQATEDARLHIAARLEAMDADLYAARQARTGAETALQTANTQLVQAEEARQNIETAWQLAEYKAITLTAQLKEAEAALSSASHQARLHNAKHTPGAARDKTARLDRKATPASQRTAARKPQPVRAD